MDYYEDPYPTYSTTFLTMAAQNQKAVVLLKRFGDLAVTSLAVPKPSKGEVLIKVHSTALNPVDWKVQKFGAFITEESAFPAVLGMDLAGEVVELGEGVTQWKIGDRVFCQTSYDKGEGSFQQYAIAGAEMLATIPSNISYDQASTLPVAITAPYVALYCAKPNGLGFEPPVTAGGRGKYAGTPIVILGGPSSVGQFAIQLAKLSGFSPIITTSSPKHKEWLLSLGATDIIDRSLPLDSTKEAIGKITDKPILTVIDTISSEETQNVGLDLLAPSGQLGLVLYAIEGLVAKAEAQGKFVVSVMGMKKLPHLAELLRGFYGNISKLLEHDDIKPNKVEVLPDGLNSVADGLKRLEENKVSGVKLVAHPQETE
ncbi:hypothetical protein EST38_g13104 [Candolleomyces aberdarensis]|uniref:Enoyl reductase (ER) domain-containing protein n=1 Tax=Candolleomyces aberdarensis TaxID=2316362 RepID=A0A4Q2D1H5_9AGAR|nr:hypothetical protein EST38_g13104 [Candolleomyces aberdarensis]